MARESFSAPHKPVWIDVGTNTGELLNPENAFLKQNAKPLRANFLNFSNWA